MLGLQVCAKEIHTTQTRDLVTFIIIIVVAAAVVVVVV